MNCKRIVRSARVSAIALTVLTLALFAGCAQYESGKEVDGYVVKPWSFVREWMKSSECYDWDDKFMGICETKNAGSEMFEVCFTPAWGRQHMVYDVTNCYCYNISGECLKISAFPPFANAIELVGAFDVSEADIDKNIEYYHWDKGSCSSFEYNNGNLDVQFPSFPADSKLRYLELDLPSMEGCYNYVPVLNLERYADLCCLKKIYIHSYFPLAGIERLLAKSHLESAEFEMSFQSSDWRACGINANDCMGRDDDNLFRGIFDDKSFDELLKVDFSNYDDIDIKINLVEIRHLDIHRLLGDESTYRCIKIESNNCVIDNLPCVIDYKKELIVLLSMSFNLDGQVSEGDF